MKVLKTVDNGNQGNDCYIYRTYTLINSHNRHYVLRHVVIVGAFEEDVIQTLPVDELSAELFQKDFETWHQNNSNGF